LGIGVIFRADDNQNLDWSLRYSSVLNCSGADGIHHGTYYVGTVEYCNFFGNTAHSSIGFLHGYQAGFLIRFCIFEATNGLDIYLYSIQADKAFVVLNCVFSAFSLGNAGYYSSTSGNSFGVTTASLNLANLAAQVCPMMHPPATTSPPFLGRGFSPGRVIRYGQFVWHLLVLPPFPV
jgi:hypothetical protein